MNSIAASSMTTVVTEGYPSAKTSPLTEVNLNKTKPPAQTQPQKPTVNAAAEIDVIANVVIDTIMEGIRLSLRADPLLQETDFIIERLSDPDIDNGKPFSLPIDVKKLFSFCKNVVTPPQPKFQDYVKKVTDAASHILSKEASIPRAFVEKYNTATGEKAAGSLFVKKVTIEVLSHVDGGAFRGTPLEELALLHNPFEKTPAFRAALKRTLTQ